MDYTPGCFDSEPSEIDSETGFSKRIKPSGQNKNIIHEPFENPLNVSYRYDFATYTLKEELDAMAQRFRMDITLPGSTYTAKYQKEPENELTDLEKPTIRHHRRTKKPERKDTKKSCTKELVQSKARATGDAKNPTVKCQEIARKPGPSGTKKPPQRSRSSKAKSPIRAKVCSWLKVKAVSKVRKSKRKRSPPKKKEEPITDGQLCTDEKFIEGVQFAQGLVPYCLEDSLVDVLRNAVNLKTKTKILKFVRQNELILEDLIGVMDETLELKLFKNGLDHFYHMLMKGDLIKINKLFDIRDYIDEDVTFVNLIHSLCSIEVRFERDQSIEQGMKVDIYIKILRIIDLLCGFSDYQDIIRNTNADILQIFFKLLLEHSNRNILTSLLGILKVICKNPKNCHSLNNRQFYNGLVASYKLTEGSPLVIDILRILSDRKTWRIFMCHEAEAIELIFKFAVRRCALSTCRCTALEILQRITLSATGRKILSPNEEELFCCFMRSQREGERCCRFKMYAILNRFQNTTVLKKTPLIIDLYFPNYINPYLGFEDSSTEEDLYSLTETIHKQKQRKRKPKAKSPIKAKTTTKDDEFIMQWYFVEYAQGTFRGGIFPPPDIRLYRHLKPPFNFMQIQERVNRTPNPKIRECGLAYPDAVMFSPDTDNHIVQKNTFPLTYLGNKLKTLRKGIKPRYRPRVVFNLDELYLKHTKTDIPHPKLYVVPPEPEFASEVKGDLQFESRFENGNLRRATKIDKYEYDLELSPETLGGLGTWFYFQISNMQSLTEYRFNIINYISDIPLYNDGMIPVFFSTIYYCVYNISWQRVKGTAIFYGNHYTNERNTSQYKTLTFTAIFPFDADYVYIAHHFPYSYTRLMTLLAPFPFFNSDKIYTRIESLCKTVDYFNDIPILTITAMPKSTGRSPLSLRGRPVIFLIARVHAGDSNSSWVMEGLIRHLLDEDDSLADRARQNFVFKIIPMFNVSGVMYGNSKLSVTGQDLSTCWQNPTDITTPEVFYTKKLMQFIKVSNAVEITTFIEVRGGANTKLCTLTACNPNEDYYDEEDRLRTYLFNQLKLLPTLLYNINPNFVGKECNFVYSSQDEGQSARYTMWKEFDIMHSYTLECSFGEAYYRQSMNPSLLSKIGSNIIDAFGSMTSIPNREAHASFFKKQVKETSALPMSESPSPKYRRKKQKKFTKK